MGNSAYKFHTMNFWYLKMNCNDVRCHVLNCNVSYTEIEYIRIDADIRFTKVAEAKEYRETILLRQSLNWHGTEISCY